MPSCAPCSRLYHPLTSSFATTEVDRSAAYVARWIAKSLVAADLVSRITVQLSYAIGVAEPLSIFVDTYGTAKEGVSDADLVAIIRKNWDLRPGVVVKELGLQSPQGWSYQQTASYGHFGREEAGFPWEQPRKLNL